MRQLCIFHFDFNYVNLRPDYIRKWLHLVARMGYNAILWEPEDKVAWQSCAQAIWQEALSKQDFKELIREADALGLESIPLLQSVGHAEYILKHDAYRHMRELPDHHDCYCTENRATRDFLKNLITEYLEVFGNISRFHLGGDEAYVFAKCPTCAKEAKRVGVMSLYSRHISELAAVLKTEGIRAGVWSDMVLAHPDQIKSLPTSIDIWDWNYWDGDKPNTMARIWGHKTVPPDSIPAKIKAIFPEITNFDGMYNNFYTAEVLKRMGYEVILCGAARSSGDTFFAPSINTHAANIAGATRKVRELGLAGTCVTSWAIRLNSWETQRTLLGLAPRLLCDPSADLKDLHAEIATDLFGCDGHPFIEAINKISSVALPFSRQGSTAVQWNGLKDSLPAPKDFIEKLVTSWATDNRLKTELEKCEAALLEINDGMNQLHAFAQTAVNNLDLLHHWTLAAGLQYWQARVAIELLQQKKEAGLVSLLRNLKGLFEQYLLFSQTPISAAKNSALVYDALIEFSGE